MEISRSVELSSLLSSRKRQNELPDDSTFADFQAVSDLCSIITKYQVEDQYKVHRLHKHSMVPEGHIILGQHTLHPPGVWVSNIPIAKVDLQNIYPYTLSIDDSGELCPTEWREGFHKHMQIEFLRDFFNYIQERYLGNMFALQYRDPQEERGKKVEFAFNAGNFTIASKFCVVLLAGSPYNFLQTSWVVDNGNIEGEVYCIVVEKAGHLKVIIENSDGFKGAICAIRNQGLLV
ncbi:hypothetical protein EJ08DRAFT_99914 [Tothia fuscella]|uniref:Uncharacterized protein n=1 Tax=Tothia fuscella TaxID=1048955 RepID=A0A9P4U1F1_9PEZI|nr:hypothetical protein EJ08DRAFT_99914 [Tothia fuscella]